MGMGRRKTPTFWMIFAVVIIFVCVYQVIVATFSSDDEKTVKTEKELEVKVAIPAFTASVVDTTGTIPKTDIDRITRAIQYVEQVTEGQIAVLFIDTLSGVPMERYCTAVFEKWKIGGKGKDNGALLLFVLRDCKDRLEIGYGWEGVVTDAKSGDLLRSIIPDMKNKRYADAAISVVNGVGALVAEDRKVPFHPEQFQRPLQGQNTQENQEEQDDVTATVVTLIWIAIVLIIIFYGGGRGRRGHWGGFGGGGGSFGGGGGGSGFSGGGGGRSGGGGASGGW